MREQGIVQMFDRVRGYGFIVCMSGDIFVHASDIANGSKSLCAGELVEFDIVTARRGLRAKNVSEVCEVKNAT